MRTIKRGDSGPEVGLLRRLLNRNVRPSPNIAETNIFGSRYNGAVRNDFGPQMEEAVKQLQTSRGMPPNGIVGPPVWNALGLTLDISRPVMPASQPTNNTCYAAAATMVIGPQASASFQVGATPPGVAPDDYWASSFAKQFSWKLEYGTSYLPDALAGFLNGGPFWFAGNLPFPGGPGYHAVVVGSKWGDRDPFGTMLLIYDPWPVSVGEVYGIILGDYVRSFPSAMRYVLHR